MSFSLILASSSEIRRHLLKSAQIPFEVQPPRVDEEGIKASLLAAGTPPRDVADALAEAKARKVGHKSPGRLVLGSDQVLSFDGQVYSKPTSQTDALGQLRRFNGKTHELNTAAVIYDGPDPIWRHVGVVKMHMRRVSDSYLDDYVARNWDSLKHTVGAYKLEEEGVRLFHKVDGDYFHVLGLPLLEVIGFLTLRGEIDG